MSIPVGLDRLRHEIAARGPVAFLMTVGAESRPHIVALGVEWAGDEFALAPGNSSTANARERRFVTLLWPDPGAGELSLIVDATVTSVASTDSGGNRVVVAPTHAVLHRAVAPGDDAMARCIPVYPGPDRVASI
jgi:hypothetical protein